MIELKTKNENLSFIDETLYKGLQTIQWMVPDEKSGLKDFPTIEIKYIIIKVFY